MSLQKKPQESRFDHGRQLLLYLNANIGQLLARTLSIEKIPQDTYWPVRQIVAEHLRVMVSG